MLFQKYRQMKRYLTVLILQLFITGAFAYPHNTSDTALPQQALRYIDPTIGNVGALLEPTRPTVFLPNQVIRMYPLRKDYMDGRISSFPLTMVSHRLGEAFSVKPCTGDIGSADWDQRMPY